MVKHACHNVPMLCGNSALGEVHLQLQLQHNRAVTCLVQLE